MDVQLEHFHDFVDYHRNATLIDKVLDAYDAKEKHKKIREIYYYLT